MIEIKFLANISWIPISIWSQGTQQNILANYILPRRCPILDIKDAAGTVLELFLLGKNAFEPGNFNY